MMNMRNEDNLPKGAFYGLVLDKILVDVFKPKFGDEKDLAVFSFFVKQRDAANKLMRYIVGKNIDLLDVDVSPNPKPGTKKDGKYILFIEMNRSKDMFVTMDKLLLHIDHLVSIKKWYFRASADNEYMDWNRDNFVKVVPQTPDGYSNKNGPHESDHAPQKSKAADNNHRFLEEISEGPVAKFSQSYIKSLKKQIKAINENNLQMSGYIEDLKIDKEKLYKQLELYHDREKMALIREQQDFKRIRSLENQLLLLAAPNSREMKIVTPDKNTYDTDLEPAIGGVATEGGVEDAEEIYSEIQDEFKETEEGDPHPDEVPALNESSDLDVVLDHHDKISFRKSSGFVNKEHREHSDVDESIEKTDKQPDHKVYIHTEKEKIEEPDNERGNGLAEPFVSKEDDKMHKPEMPVERIDPKPVKSSDSAETARLNDMIPQSVLEESSVKVDNESYLADDPVPKYMALALEALKKEDYDNAIEYFLKVVERLPTAGTVVLNLADLYFLKKEYEVARKYAIQALELGEVSATLVLEKIKSVLASDSALPAIGKSGQEVAEEVIARVEGYKEGAEEIQDTMFIELAAFKEVAGLTHSAKTASFEDGTFKDADEKIDPKKVAAREYMSLGVKATGLKDYHKAIEYFSKAVEILPDNAAGFCNLAVLNYRLKEYAPAYRYAGKAIDLGSLSAIRILEKIKRVMVADLKSPARFEPNVEIEKIKSSPVAEKDESEAFFIESGAVTLDEFLKTEIQSDLAVDTSLREKDVIINDNFKLGLATFEKKEFRKAIGHFNKVVELLPNGIPSYIHLTKIHYFLGEYPQARKHAKKAFELGDHTLKPILEEIEAKLAKDSSPFPSAGSIELKEQETPAEAIEGTQEEPEVPEPHDDSVPDKKGGEDEPEPEMMRETQDVELAKPATSGETSDSSEKPAPSSIEKSTPKDDDEKIDPKNDAKKYMALGVEAASQQDYHKAVEHFNKVIEIIPDSAVGFFNLAIIHKHLDNYDTACEHAEKALSLGLYSAQSILEKIKLKMEADSKIPPAKKKEKPTAEEALIEIDEAKPIQITGAQLKIENKESGETITQGKTDLKHAQDLVESAVPIAPSAGEGFASETLTPAASAQTENPQNEYASASEHFELGLAASERDDFSVALEYFNKVAMALPEVPSSFLNMADVHYRMKNYETARKHAKRALELGANSAHRILSKIEDKLESKSKGSSLLLPVG